jgi:hypothetical protein
MRSTKRLQKQIKKARRNSSEKFNRKMFNVAFKRSRRAVEDGKGSR